MSIEKNKEVALKVTQAVTNQDFEYIKDTFSDDVKIWVAGSIPDLSGTHGREFLDRLEEGMPLMWPNGMSLTAKEMTAEGDRVAVEAETLGKHVNGKTYNNFFHLLLVIRDGKVHEWKEYMDTMHANDVLV